METLNTKKIIIIFSVIITIVVAAILLAVTTGNVNTPQISDPNGVFYQRVDDQGNVLYTITNEEVFNKVKSQDGITQLMLMTDSMILSDYMNQVTDDEITDKIKELTYGTSDDAKIADIDADQKQSLEDQFNQSMVLAGYENNEDQYAKILVAREKYVAHAIDANGEVTDNDVAQEFVDNYFNDIDAIKIRFTSQDDVLDVMHKYNLVATKEGTLAIYNGYVYNKDDLTDNDGNMVQAYITVDAYYFDEDNNIVNTDEDIVYTLGDDGVYTDSDDNEYTIKDNNLIDSDETVIVSGTVIFDSLTAAQAYKDANTTYYTVTKNDPFDENETTKIYNSANALAFYIDPDGTIYDAHDVDVTDTTDLYVNKVYKSIDDASNLTVDETTALTDQELLDIFIKMYNYVYGEYRDTLPENATAADLIALNDEHLQFNFDDVNSYSPDLATYMFDTLSSINDKYYSPKPQNISNSYYLVYKLTSPEKVDVRDIVLDAIQDHIVIPTQVGGDITLPTSGAYDSTISWLSSAPAILDKTGKFTAPDEDKTINMTWSITALGETRSGTIQVKALADGDTVVPDQPDWTPTPLKTIINDDTVYNMLYNRLIDDQVTGSDSDTTIKSHLADLRNELGFKINDQYLAYDYTTYDSDYTFSGSGNKTVVASFDKTLDSDSPLNISADDFFKYAVDKNAALYTIYTTQFKELLNSTFYTTVFGDEKDLTKNKSLRMTDMLDILQKTKSNYLGLKNLYAQYGMTFPYEDYTHYIYKQYRVNKEYDLIKYFVTGVLQPYLIQETFDKYDIENKIYPTIEDYYNNYFSLNVSHLLIYVDFDEDGKPDNFIDYQDSLSAADLTAFNSEVAKLEDEINNYTGDFSALVQEYNSASRDDATWGEFKQLGIMLLTEDLNVRDKDDNTVTHSLTYTGDYGIKDTYAPQFVEALENLYDVYQEPVNQDEPQMYSNLVKTEFGLHKILVTKGDDFDQPSCKFPVGSEDTSNYSQDLLNDNGMPTMDQVKVYLEYKFYSLIYDLTDTEVENKYNVDIPDFPAAVKSALDFYVGDIIDNVYVIGTVNISMSARLQDGEITTGNQYIDMTNSEFDATLTTVGNVYYHALFDDYVAADNQ